MKKFVVVLPFDLDQIIELIRETKYVSSKHAHTLLKYCVSTIESKETRRNRLDQLVPLLQSVLKLDVNHFNAILEVPNFCNLN